MQKAVLYMLCDNILSTKKSSGDKNICNFPGIYYFQFGFQIRCWPKNTANLFFVTCTHPSPFSASLQYFVHYWKIFSDCLVKLLRISRGEDEFKFSLQKRIRHGMNARKFWSFFSCLLLSIVRRSFYVNC